MNFFEHQDRARKKTGRLVILFIIAVVMILLAMNCAGLGLAIWAGIDPPPELFLGITAITLLIILGGSAYKMMMLKSGGGPAVAQLMGGRPLAAGSDRNNERVLQNVVEEMSIASGVPVPQVYVLDDEESINAFAAGFGPDDTVIGVTRGALNTLKRDELQGVIAHEYSHILNSDTRLNLRLMGVLNGILILSLLGRIILSSLRYTRVPRRRSNNKGGGGEVLFIIGAGAALFIIGSVGMLFAKMIQAAVSRQREFLADASAVQFTRNPSGLAGALRRLAAQGSHVESPHALEAAHLFFGNTSSWSFTRLLATHPPLDQRIRAIDPTWDGKFEMGPGAMQMLDDVPPSQKGEVMAQMLAGSATRRPVNVDAIADRAGELAPAQVRYAGELLASVPAELTEAAHQPFSARAVVFGLLVNAEPEVRQKQLDIIKRSVDEASYRYTLDLIDPITAMGPGARLPLLDLAIPALRGLSPRQAEPFMAIVRSMIEADGKITLFEFALYRIIEKRLASATSAQSATAQYYTVSQIKSDAAIVLSALAVASGAQTEMAFSAGARMLDPDQPPTMVKLANLRPLYAALRRLSQSTPTVKKRLIDAMAHTIAADGLVNVEESELLRATAATLDVPLPPLITA